MRYLPLIALLTLTACADATDTSKDKKPEPVKECTFSNDCHGDEGICWHKTRRKWLCVECVKDDQCDEGGVCIDAECRY
jgi:hypothetical protein